jgi:hypothetical protein
VKPSRWSSPRCRRLCWESAADAGAGGGMEEVVLDGACTSTIPCRLLLPVTRQGFSSPIAFSNGWLTRQDARPIKAGGFRLSKKASALLGSKVIRLSKGNCLRWLGWRRRCLLANAQRTCYFCRRHTFAPEFDVSQILENLEQLEVCIPYSFVENSPIPNSEFRIPNSGLQ